MKKYILTSPKFEGQVTFGYNGTGQLVVFYNESTLDHKGNDWLLNHLPTTEPGLLWLKTKIEGSLVEVPEDLTFDRFWNAYNIKHNRKRTEPLYHKLNDAEKLLAIIKINNYLKYCGDKGRGVADPEKYLRDRYFDTDWLKMK